MPTPGLPSCRLRTWRLQAHDNGRSGDCHTDVKLHMPRSPACLVCDTRRARHDNSDAIASARCQRRGAPERPAARGWTRSPVHRQHVAASAGRLRGDTLYGGLCSCGDCIRQTSSRGDTGHERLSEPKRRTVFPSIDEKLTSPAAVPSHGWPLASTRLSDSVEECLEHSAAASPRCRGRFTQAEYGFCHWQRATGQPDGYGEEQQDLRQNRKGLVGRLDELRRRHGTRFGRVASIGDGGRARPRPS